MPTDAELAHRLAQMQKSFDEAPAEPPAYGSIDDIPDGDYQAVIQAFDFFEGNKDPDAFYFKIITSIKHDAEYAGRELSRLHNLFPKGTPEEIQLKLGFLKQDLHALGVNVEEFDLTQVQPGAQWLNDLLDVPVLMGVYTSKKGYKNVAIRQRLDGSDLGTAQEQIEGFERNETLTETQKRRSGKPKDCICPDPENGDFSDECPVAGHGIAF